MSVFKYNPHSHVKVWLSNNPEVFMNFENQTRLIDMREKCPNDPIHLIYGSSLLNKKARAELMAYCTENDITPIDADNKELFYNNLQTDDARELYDFYKDEITHLKEGGNLGVASDILRWLRPSYRLGSYTDLDVPLNTKGFSTSVKVNSPLLLNIRSLKLLGKQEMVITLNEFIAVVDEDAAKEQIERVHKGLLRKLRHYSSDYIEKTEELLNQGSFLNRIFLGYIKNQAEALYIQRSTELKAPNGGVSSRNLRAYVNEVMSDKAKFIAFHRQTPDEQDAQVIARLRSELKNQLGSIKWLFFRKDYYEVLDALKQNDDGFLSYLMKKERSLYLKSIVVCTTGPIQVGSSLYNNYVMTSDEVNEKVQPSTFSFYNLHKAFLSRNVIPLHENAWAMLKYLGTDVGELNDSSWLEEGINLQESREERLLREKEQLAHDLPRELCSLQDQLVEHLEKLKTESTGYLAFLQRERRTAKIRAIQNVLDCFKDDSFNVKQFRIVLADIRANNGVYAGFFSNDTKMMIEKLEDLCHKAVVFRLAKDKKLPTIHIQETLPKKSQLPVAPVTASKVSNDAKERVFVKHHKTSKVSSCHASFHAHPASISNNNNHSFMRKKISGAANTAANIVSRNYKRYS